MRILGESDLLFGLFVRIKTVNDIFHRALALIPVQGNPCSGGSAGRLRRFGKGLDTVSRRDNTCLDGIGKAKLAGSVVVFDDATGTIDLYAKIIRSAAGNGIVFNIGAALLTFRTVDSDAVFCGIAYGIGFNLRAAAPDQNSVGTTVQCIAGDQAFAVIRKNTLAVGQCIACNFYRFSGCPGVGIIDSLLSGSRNGIAADHRLGASVFHHDSHAENIGKLVVFHDADRIQNKQPDRFLNTAWFPVFNLLESAYAAESALSDGSGASLQHGEAPWAAALHRIGCECAHRVAHTQE